MTFLQSLSVLVTSFLVVVQARATPPAKALDAVLASLSPQHSPAVCSALKEYPRASNEKLSFESDEISALCRPFVHRSRSSLDLCGDTAVDPYSSHFSWPSRDEMYKRGNINIVTDPSGHALYGELMAKVEDVRRDTEEICCAGEERCEQAMAKVNVDVCKPKVGSSAPDECVYGGVFQVSPKDFKAIGVRLRAGTTASAKSFYPTSGEITLSSYLTTQTGVHSIEPVIRHEFGHACSMIKMQLAAANGSSHAQQWLKDVKNRCSRSAELPEAYYDFWESVGESREFAGCLYKLAKLNQAGTIDRACDRLCPGHYMEESVGIAFSLLTGDLSGKAGAVFPNTCNHIRDAQHPLVSDVLECLTQHSPRFRQRLSDTYSCALHE